MDYLQTTFCVTLGNEIEGKGERGRASQGIHIQTYLEVHIGSPQKISSSAPQSYFLDYLIRFFKESLNLSLFIF